MVKLLISADVDVDFLREEYDADFTILESWVRLRLLMFPGENFGFNFEISELITDPAMGLADGTKCSVCLVGFQFFH